MLDFVKKALCDYRKRLRPLQKSMKFCVAKLPAKMRSILAAHRHEKGRRLSAMKRRTSYSVRIPSGYATSQGFA
jgi:hypothetical protein